MTNIETIYLFGFIFSTILLVRTALKFIISLLQTKPEKMVLSNREILFNGLSLSYLITYLIQV